jgi:NADPH-dependent curcumin reductase CurA
MVTSREIHLKSRPAGMPAVDNFDVATVSVPDPAPGEVQVRNLWMSVDPYMRNRMANRARNAPPRDDRISEIAASNATMFAWRPPFELGEVLQGGAIGEVVASNDQSLRLGDLVSSWLGWREVFNAPRGTLEKLETFGLFVQTLLGVAGMTGLTAWVGLSKIAALKQPPGLPARTQARLRRRRLFRTS